MARYFYPDAPGQAYDPQGLLRELQIGDFFKCAGCRQFQRHEDRFRAHDGELVQLFCRACAGPHQAKAWQLPAKQSTPRPKPPGINYPPARRGDYQFSTKR